MPLAKGKKMQFDPLSVAFGGCQSCIGALPQGVSPAGAILVLGFLGVSLSGSRRCIKAQARP